VTGRRCDSSTRRESCTGRVSSRLPLGLRAVAVLERGDVGWPEAEEEFAPGGCPFEDRGEERLRCVELAEGSEAADGEPERLLVRGGEYVCPGVGIVEGTKPLRGVYNVLARGGGGVERFLGEADVDERAELRQGLRVVVDAEVPEEVVGGGAVADEDGGRLAAANVAALALGGIEGFEDA